MDLTGLDFLWSLITDCSHEDIADLAIDYFLQKTYLNVNAKLKKDSVTLHQVFDCLAKPWTGPRSAARLLKFPYLNRSFFDFRTTLVAVAQVVSLNLG